MSSDEHFNFVKALSRDLNRDDISLPSFPDVVVRIRSALDDPDTTGEDLADILSMDTALASRVLVLANSTYYNPAGVKIEGLGAAVGRVGFEKVRTASIAYAVEQLHGSEKLEPLKDELRKSWSLGLRHAALAEVIARDRTKLDADSAFIAGLLHRIGTLYIFTKYDEFPNLLQNPEARQSLIDEWCGPIGQSIVAHWQFSEDIQNTLNPNGAAANEPSAEPTLTDVIVTAKLAMVDTDVELQECPESRRLNLTEADMPLIIEAYKARLDSLVSAVR